MVYKNWHACGAASSMDLYCHGDIMIDDQLLKLGIIVGLRIKPQRKNLPETKEKYD